jgi:hypothetical protein
MQSRPDKKTKNFASNNLKPKERNSLQDNVVLISPPVGPVTTTLLDTVAL